MTKAKGEKYKCENCGLVILVEDPCGCEKCELLCCDQPMKPVKEKQAQDKKQPIKPKK